jgi:dTDP-4-amino-4,6-dideoxygalactose transaminase
VAAIDLAGATPLLVDVDPQTYTMDPARLEEALRRDRGRTIRAVIPVHLYGHPADMPAVMQIARRAGVYVIEDCAQAHGGTLAGGRVGSFGDFGAFSFYPTKNLGALGDGGALVTDDPKLADRAQLLKQYGWRERYVSHLAGMNTRLDEIQAAVLRARLPYLDEANACRRDLARLYNRALAGGRVEPPAARREVYHVYHQYVVRTRQRDALRSHLQEAGIGTAILYPVPVHLQPGYRDRVRIGPGGLAQTERLCGEILSLPLYPELPEGDARRVAREVAAWAAAAD